jgi:hypothetical protein
MSIATEVLAMRTRRLVAAALALSLAGCGGPAAPSQAPSDGIVLYEHPGFKGGSLELTSDVDNLGVIGGPCNPGMFYSNWNDCVSSIRVPPGWQAIIYEDPLYRGKAFTVTGDISDLEHSPDPTNWDDKISSVRVLRP